MPWTHINEPHFDSGKYGAVDVVLVRCIELSGFYLGFEIWERSYRFESRYMAITDGRVGGDVPLSREV